MCSLFHVVKKLKKLNLSSYFNNKFAHHIDFTTTNISKSFTNTSNNYIRTKEADWNGSEVRNDCKQLELINLTILRTHNIYVTTTYHLMDDSIKQCFYAPLHLTPKPVTTPSHHPLVRSDLSLLRLESRTVILNTYLSHFTFKTSKRIFRLEISNGELLIIVLLLLKHCWALR